MELIKLLIGSAAHLLLLVLKEKKYFRGERQAIGLKKEPTFKAAQRIARELNLDIDGMFPYLKKNFDQSTKIQRKDFYETS